MHTILYINTYVHMYVWMWIKLTLVCYTLPTHALLRTFDANSSKNTHNAEFFHERRKLAINRKQLLLAPKAIIKHIT